MRFSNYALALLTLVNAASAVDETCQSIAEIACGNDSFSLLCTAVVEAGLDDALSGGSWTVFAPTNNAIQNLGQETIDTVLGDVDILTNILLFHAVDSALYASDLSCSDTIAMANGNDSRTVCVGGKIFQKGAGNPRDNMPEITATDIMACNGVVHVVDEVMLPPNAIPDKPPAPKPTSSPVASPTEPTPAPVASPTEPTSAPVQSPPSGCANIAELACEIENLSILCSAVIAAGLEEALSGGTWTVFAPTDDAIMELGQETIDLLLDQTNFLLDILLFHAVSGKELYAGDLSCSDTVHMANGFDSRTVCTGGSIFQKGGANPRDDMPKIITTDVKACNGVVHVVDEVMLFPGALPDAPPAPTPTKAPTETPPECMSIAEIACGTEGFSTLCDAVVAAGLDGALSGGQWTVFAPTNSAFEDLGEATLNAVLGDEDLLTYILTFHAVDSVLYASDLECSELVHMVNGKDSRTVCSGGYIFQKGSGNPRDDMPKITTTDIKACNGVVHVVDAVMLP